MLLLLPLLRPAKFHDHGNDDDEVKQISLNTLQHFLRAYSLLCCLLLLLLLPTSKLVFLELLLLPACLRASAATIRRPTHTLTTLAGLLLPNRNNTLLVLMYNSADERGLRASSSCMCMRSSCSSRQPLPNSNLFFLAVVTRIIILLLRIQTRNQIFLFLHRIGSQTPGKCTTT